MKSILRKQKTTVEEREDVNQMRMERLFELPTETGAARVNRRDSKGHLRILGVLPVSDVSNADDLLTTLEERWGGGKYFIMPTVDGKKAGEGFHLELDGEPKEQKKKRGEEGEERRGSRSDQEKIKELEAKLKEKDAEDKLRTLIREELSAKNNGTMQLVNSAMQNLPQIVSLFAGNRDKQPTLTELTEAIKNLQSLMAQQSPMQLAREALDLVSTVGGMNRPPVEIAGSRGAGLGTTFLGNMIGSALSGTVEQIGQGLMNRFGLASGATNPGLLALAQGSQPRPAPVEQGSAGSGGFSGLENPGNPGGGSAGLQQAQSEAIPAGLTLASMGIDPVIVLRSWISQKADPEAVSTLVVILVDYLGRVLDRNSPLLCYMRGFVTDPAVNLDKAIALIPELRQLQNQDTAYFQKLRGEIIAAVRQYHSDMTSGASRRPEAGQPEPAAGPAGQGASVEAREPEKERSVENAEKNQD